jgi:hypothetical protein
LLSRVNQRRPGFFERRAQIDIRDRSWIEGLIIAANPNNANNATTTAPNATTGLTGLFCRLVDPLSKNAWFVCCDDTVAPPSASAAPSTTATTTTTITTSLSKVLISRYVGCTINLTIIQPFACSLFVFS